MKDRVKEMFYHGYNNYMKYAFPHDELKPLSGSWTDSLAELGNANKRDTSAYQGMVWYGISETTSHHASFEVQRGLVVNSIGLSILLDYLIKCTGVALDFGRFYWFA